MYSYNRTKTLIRFFKNVDKNIVFRDCQMHFFLVIFYRYFVDLPAKNPLLLDYF